MKTKSNVATAKQAHAKKLESYRIIVRGTETKTDEYKRRVRVVYGTYENAWKEAEKQLPVLSKGLSNVFVNVFNNVAGSGYIERVS